MIFVLSPYNRPVRLDNRFDEIIDQINKNNVSVLMVLSSASNALHILPKQSSELIKNRITAFITKEYFEDILYTNTWYKQDKNELHLRFVSAMLRIYYNLELTSQQNSSERSERIKQLINLIMNYSDDIQFGKWFLHDNFEKQSVYPYKRNENNIWKSDRFNTLTLNTHTDTLYSLLLLLSQNSALEHKIKDQVWSGLESLFSVLTISKSFRHIIFDKLDGFMRGLLFRHHKQNSYFNRLLKKYVKKNYWPWRHQMKQKLPFFVFSDGFSERDIALDGSTYYYHIVNILDVSRILLTISDTGFNDNRMKEAYRNFIDKGINYCIKTNFWYYISELKNNDKPLSALYLCETIINRTIDSNQLNTDWLNAYIKLRQNLAPTTELVKKNPLLTLPNITENQKEEILKSIDVINLVNRYLFVNFSNNTINITNYLKQMKNNKGNVSKGNHDKIIIEPKTFIVIPVISYFTN